MVVILKEKTMKTILRPFICAILLIVVAISCKKDDTIDAKTLKVNTFITATMQQFYLWEDKMPTNIDYKQERDPIDYFDKLLYKAEDKWSIITDDYEGLMGSLQGQETTYGYSLAFSFKFPNDTKNVVAVVQYVYPNSAAALANLKRGDLLLEINGKTLTVDNYLQLLYSNSCTITLGTKTSGSFIPNGTVTMTASMTTLDPVVINKVIDYEGEKIGYLFYTQYIDRYTTLNNALLNFKAQNIDYLVLDLRYNPGGYVKAARHLCSALAPATDVAQEKVLITKHWSNPMKQYWQIYNPGGDEDAFEDLFDPALVSNDINMNLSKLYVLTSGRTASASELTICGLQPYMDVILVGETTVGKYVASMPLQPNVWTTWANDREINNWAIMPIVYAYANADGLTNFKNGFTPLAQYQVKDDVLDPTPLGDIHEALLSKALWAITGVAPTRAMKAPQPEPFVYEIIGTGFSRFDKFRENAIVSESQFNGLR